MRVAGRVVTLRAGIAGDREFLQRVHREAMREHVEKTWGAWDDADQRRRFDESTDPTTHEIVEYGGVPVGCQWVRSHADGMELVRLYLLPEVQGQGIGTHLMLRLCAEADRRGVPVRLRVLKLNPARRLYERLEFAIVEETETHLVMQRTAAT